MIYENLLLDFINRTKRNLEVIQKISLDASKENQVHEVTQLINSLFGLLIFPKEKMFDSIPEIPYTDLVEKGWPKIEIIQSQAYELTLKEFVRLMRNSLAHFNVEFLSDGKTISGIKLWNIRNSKKTWEAKFEMEVLQRFIYKFCDFWEQEVKNL